MRQGKFRPAVEELRRGHELGTRNPKNWHYPSDQWLKKAARLDRADDRLAAVLQGKAQPKDAGERILFAQISTYRNQHAATLRFYEEAFAAEPKLAENLAAGHRYDAACAAALIANGKAKDVGGLDPTTRQSRRRQALDWLRADLAAWNILLMTNSAEARRVIFQKMSHWLQDADFASVRGTEALAKLPEGERSAWHKLWADVADTLAQAQGKAGPEKKAGAK